MYLPGAFLSQKIESFVCYKNKHFHKFFENEETNKEAEFTFEKTDVDRMRLKLFVDILLSD
jgi:hypothetical protein